MLIGSRAEWATEIESGRTADQTISAASMDIKTEVKIRRRILMAKKGRTELPGDTWIHVGDIHVCV